MTRRPSPRPADHQRPTLVARCAEDVLAMVPVVLGFHPDESVVLLTFGAGRRNFQARVDVPARTEDIAVVVDTLLAPAVRHAVTEAAVVAYTADAELGVATLHALVEALGEEGVRVRDALWVSGDRWVRSFPDGEPGDGEAFDISSHPFLVDAVVRGDVTHQSRESLRATLKPDPVAVAAVEGTLWLRRPALETAQRPAEVAWALTTVSSALGDPEVLTAQVAARLLAGLRDVELRDHVWFLLSRETAAAHLTLWSRLLRSAPEGFVTAPATLTGFAAWLSGQGALAWCALDRCFDEEPGEPPAVALAWALVQAVPPSVGDERAGGACFHDPA